MYQLTILMFTGLLSVAVTVKMGHICYECFQSGPPSILQEPRHADTAQGQVDDAG